MTFAVLGEALIDLIVGDDGAYHPHLGGSPFNVAVALARQGMNVSYLSTFSDDAFGDQLHDALHREQVHLPLARRSRWPTSLALVTVGPEGQPSYRLYREGIADKDTQLEEILACIPRGLRVFHTGSLAITPSQLPKIRSVFRRLRASDVVISIDINIRLRGSMDVAKYLSGVRSLLPEADIVKASDEDIDAFGLAADPRAGAQKLYAEMDGGIMVLTTGTGGAVLLSQLGTTSRPAYPIPAVADTVGAGDTFHAAFLAALYRGNRLQTREVSRIPLQTLTQALDFACAAAAINVSRVGCSPPTRDEVDSLIAAARR